MSELTPVELLRSRLENVRPNGRGFTARCPAHEDLQNSLSVTEGEDGHALVKCFRGCKAEGIVEEVGLTLRDLFLSNGNGQRSPQGRSAGASTSPPNGIEHSNGSVLGCTLDDYAAAKCLPTAFLKQIGLRQDPSSARPPFGFRM